MYRPAVFRLLRARPLSSGPLVGRPRLPSSALAFQPFSSSSLRLTVTSPLYAAQSPPTPPSRTGKGKPAPRSPAERPPPPPPSSASTSAPVSASASASATTPASASRAVPSDTEPTINVSGPTRITPPPSQSTPSPSDPTPSIPSSSTAGPDLPIETAEPVDFRTLRLPSLDINTEEATAAIDQPKEGEGSGSGGTGARRARAGRKDYQTSIERQRRRTLQIFLATGALASTYAVYVLATEDLGISQPTGAAAPARPSSAPVSTWDRLTTNFGELFGYFNNPAFKQLLPDPLPPPHQRPYTLLIDLEGMLVHSTWDRQHGWRTAKRPGVDYFLGYLSQFYEVVLFTSQPMYTANPVAEKLDPFQATFPYRLYREATRYVDGKVVKDLSFLNRPLEKVVLVDTNPEHAALQPDNAVIIPQWTGNPNDRGLIELVPFLEAIPFFNFRDVRPFIKKYQGVNIPVEYAKQEAEYKRQAVEEWNRAHPSQLHGGGTGFLSSMFGSISNPGTTSRPSQPLSFIERKRQEAQKSYELEKKYFADHEEEFKQMIEEDRQRQLAEMKGSLWGWMSGAGPAPPQAAAEQKK